MRHRLFAAAALAPLCLAATRALATDTISNGVTSPIATATATSGGPDSIDVAAGGSVTVSGSTPAITLNSGSAAMPNNVTVEGSVSLSGVNNSVAVQALGGANGVVVNTGTISNSESYSVTTNSNGLSQAPFASPTSAGRIGIQVTGTGTFNGSITNAGTLNVQGSNNNGAGLPSYGIDVETAVSGGVTNSGTLTYTGDGGAALYSKATTSSATGGLIGGQVVVTGAITARGTGSSAINLQGGDSFANTATTGAHGSIAIYNSVTATGYASTTRPTITTTLTGVESANSGNEAQVLQSGAAVTLAGPIAGGVFIGAPPVGTTTSTASTVDLDGDGVPDLSEGVGSVINYGSAPALVLGGVNPTTIGVVGGADTTAAANSFGSSNQYALIIRGSVAGQGVYDGFGATGIQIGGTGGTTVLAGGVRVVGSVAADSFMANATAIHIGSGATVPQIRNEDFIESSVATSSATVANPAELAGYTTKATSSAILIDGAASGNPSVSNLSNFGTLQATANGDAMSAKTVVDNSGSLSTVLNEGVIAASVTPTTSGLAIPAGDEVALDLSHNTSGVTLTQQVTPNPVAVEVSTTTNAAGVVTTTAAFSTATASSTTTVTTTTAGVTTTTTTTTPTYPQIIGDVLLDNGANAVNILGGSVTGVLSLGTGADSVVIDNGAVYTGAMVYKGSALALNVNNGILYNTYAGGPLTGYPVTAAAGPTRLSSLNVGSKGVLYVALDPLEGTANEYVVNGTATLASGAKLGIILNSALTSETSYTLVQATTLQDNSGGALSTAAIPFIINGAVTSNAAAGTISVDLRPKTASELGLNRAESAALGGVLGSLNNDPSIQTALLSTYTQGAFLGVYDQLLPDYAGGLFELTLAASDAVTRATSRVNDIANPSGTRGAWAEEVAFGVNRNRDSTSAGYQGGGFGFVGGLEAGGSGFGAFGLTGSFLTGDTKDPHAPGENLQSFSEGEGGAYWQGQLGGLRADARVGGGYVLYSDRRELLLKNASGAIALDRNAKGSTSGYTVTGHVGVGYQTPQFGLFYFRPQVRGDYFRLQQSGFDEHGGGDGFDLSLASKTGTETSGAVSLVTGMSFGSTFQWRPELELGYRNVFTGQAGNTTANFANAMGVAAASFTLPADDIKGGGPLARLGVKADTDFYELNFEAGVEQRTHFEEGDLRISVRVLF